MIEAALLGLVQGLTEFFPVSSTAHLVLLPWFFHWTSRVNTLEFDVALHGGTLLALLLYFWKDWFRMLGADRRLLGLVLVATVPAGVVGVALEKVVESALRGPLVIAFNLVLFGVVMLLAERSRGQRSLSELTMVDAVVIGLAQAIAIMPGVSRSGITISAGLFRHMDREAAARFSFFMSAPVIGGAFILQMKDVLKSPAEWPVDLMALGFGVAFVSGLFAIRFLLWFFRRFPLNGFVYYRVVLAGIIMVLWLRG